jgi:F-type H+-transporting ATPase subunit b
MAQAFQDLGINGWNLIVQLIAFIIFVWLFWRYALGPIVKVLDQRRERIEESVATAQRMQQELAATATRNEQVLADARRQAQQIVADAGARATPRSRGRARKRRISRRST